MTDTEKMRRELAMQSAVAATVIAHLEGRQGIIPAQIANNFLYFYRQFDKEAGKLILNAVVDELEKSK